MADVERFRGPAAFGPAYRYMMEHDTHAEGSVDRALMGQMVRLREETAEYLYGGAAPVVEYRRGERRGLDEVVERETARAGTDEERVEAIARFTRRMHEGTAAAAVEEMIFGGTEEEIIARGTDFCTDAARVGAALCQAAGVASRVVYLFDTGAAYSGHAILEAWRDAAWGAVDALTGVVYRRSDGRPASVWELMKDPVLVLAHARAGAVYTTPEQFRTAGVAEYVLGRAEKHDYSTSGTNEYYRAILKESDAGWPGGLRWLFGEDHEGQ